MPIKVGHPVEVSKDALTLATWENASKGSFSVKTMRDGVLLPKHGRDCFFGLPC